MVRRFFLITALLAGAGWSCSPATWLSAAPPKVNSVFPAGVARGNSVAVTIAGDFPRWPVQVWINDPAIKLVPQSDKGKFQLSASDTAPPGVYWFRCFDDEGASTPRPVVVGTLREIEEVETNDSPAKPQAIEGPVTVNGKLARANDADVFALSLRAGQTLVASLQANTDLGSPMDAVMQVCRLSGEAATTGISRPVDAFVLEQTDDTVGIDPRLAVPIDRDGTYLVRIFAFPKVPDQTIGFAGADTFIYRLTLTTGGFIDYTRPLALQSDLAGDVELVGWNIPNPLRRLPVTAAGEGWQPVFHADLASQMQLARVPMPTLDYRASVSASRPAVELPVTITGKLDVPRQIDEFTFRGTKEKKVRLRVESRTLNFAADPILRVTDAAGKRLEETDDVGNRRDPELIFTPPDDGEFRAGVRDVHGHAGPRFVYRLTIEEAAPTFGVTLAADSFVLAAGKTVEIPVTLDRKDGFAETIAISAEGLPPDVTAALVSSEKSGATAKAVKLVLTAAESCPKFSGLISITGVCPENAAISKRTAAYPLADLNTERTDVWLTVTAAPKTP